MRVFSYFRLKSCFVFCVMLVILGLPALAQTTYSPTVFFEDSAASDQDDMAIWVHPTDSSSSVVIGSDKDNNKVFVYDLQGNTLQTLTDVGRPGNIDVRYGFMLNGQEIDIVAFNDRDNDLIRVFRIDNGLLSRVDDGAISTVSKNYGFGLYHSKTSGKYYAFTSEDNGGVIQQFELVASGNQISGNLVRSWNIDGQVEGIVADDEAGVVFLAEESKGVWKVGAEPADSTPGSMVVQEGQNGLQADVEGISLYRASGGSGYLLVSSQGNDLFKVYDRKSPHSYIVDFALSGTGSTDGIDVTSVALGSEFPKGMFITHNGDNPSRLQALSWSIIANGENLIIDTAWDPRGSLEGCSDGSTMNCGANTGACSFGTRTCLNGEWSACQGGVDPSVEICVGNIDEDCDGLSDCEDSDCKDHVACNTSTGSMNLGDMDGNGKVDIFDLILLLNRWDSSDSQADLNNSGKVDVFDLIELLQEWG